MSRRALFLTAAFLAVALVAGHPAAQGKRRKKPRPAPVSGSFTARAIPFPASQATAPLGANSCLDGVEGLNWTSHRVRAPFSGSLKVLLTGFTGDWDLFLRKGSNRVDGSTKDQVLAGAPAEERVSTPVKRGDRIDIVVCNKLGEPEATAVYTLHPKTPNVDTPFRAFSPGSYWNTPLLPTSPVDPRSGEMIRFLKNDNGVNYLTLAGADGNGDWGNPIYWSKPGHKTYNVRNSCGYRRPEEFDAVRIPPKAGHDPTSDAAMTVYDVSKGLVYGFYRARYNEAQDVWSACGGTVYHLGSNGLDGSLSQSDEPRNFGHRGVPPSTYAVRYDEIKKGAIDHVLKIAINTASEDHVWPMTGSDGDSTALNAPPEGARIRLKPSINLAKIDLTRAERTIAEALQRYGAVIGDQSGANAVLKVENTVAEGRGQLWRGILRPDSLKHFSFDDFEFVRLGYGQ